MRAVATALHRTGGLPALCRLAGQSRRQSAFPILTYHRVNDHGDPFFEALPTHVFERHMAFVARACTVLPLEELADRMRRGRVPRNAVAITFDDGYLDTLTHAAPILARLGMPATIFLATGFIGGAEALWFDRVAMAFKRTRAESYAPSWARTPMPLATRASRLDALRETLEHLKGLADEERDRSVEALRSALGAADTGSARNAMLGWDDVHALAGLGFSIGAHTVTHPILSRVSVERARSEITGSRDMIASACGRPPRAFAYPNGQLRDYTPAVTRLVQAAGFSCAVTTRFGLNSRHTPLYEMRRGGPWERDLPTFALKLAIYRATLPLGTAR
jgi:peptidoglycan/xylan/chitin deacetylase (PgdA/CDA1 family)